MVEIWVSNEVMLDTEIQKYMNKWNIIYIKIIFVMNIKQQRKYW